MAHCVAHASEGAMKVKVISILEDNYMYLVIEEQSKQAIAVDPAVPHRVRHTQMLWLQAGLWDVFLFSSNKI